MRNSKNRFVGRLKGIPYREMATGVLFVPLVYLISLLFTWPVGDFPLNDDWTYAKSVLSLVKNGEVRVGISAASLWTQICWGALFVKLFGFSFHVLRISTVVATLIGAVLLYRLLRRLGCDKTVAIAGTAVIVFNPMFYCLSVTFMTDVPFSVLLVTGIYFAVEYWRDKKTITMVLFFICCVFLVLLRQFGMLLPVAFVAAGFFVASKRVKTVVLGMIFTGIVIGVFLYYEKFLASTAQGEIYKGTEKIQVMDPAFRDLVLSRLKQWVPVMLVHIFGAAAPFLVVFFVPLIKALKAYAVPLLILAGGLAYYWLGEIWFPMGNIFTNMAVGAETFYQSLAGEPVRGPSPTYSQNFHENLQWYKIVATFICFSVIFMFALASLLKRIRITCSPMIVMAFVFLCGYAVLLCVADGIFDRYYLPMIIMLVAASAASSAVGRVVWALPFLAVFMYISVAGTKDYFELNRLRWQAYRHIKDDLGEPINRINGGYEVNSWHEGQEFVYWDSFFLHSHNYLIQYRPEPGFSVYREYSFQRYFPYKKDKIYIFERDQKLSDSQ